MPGKPRKKTAMPKKASKLDQILLHLKRIDKRFDGVDQRFDGVDQRFDGVDQRFDGVDQRFDGVEKHLADHDKQFVEIREENRKEHEHDRKMMLKLHDEQSQKIDKLQQNFDDFRNFVYDNLDALRGEYNISHDERLAMGLAQDRQQNEINYLKQSDAMQNDALTDIDQRVTQLELNKAA